MTKLQQFNLEYVAEEDRLLLRVQTVDHNEFLAWLTRHYVKQLWPLLVKLLERDPDAARQSSDTARKAVVSFQHDSAVAQTDFSKKYDPTALARPLGDLPILATMLKIKALKNGAHVLTLAPAKGQEISIALNIQYLHSFCHLLVTIATKAGWDLDLDLEPTVVAPEGARGRVM